MKKEKAILIILIAVMLSVCACAKGKSDAAGDAVAGESGETSANTGSEVHSPFTITVTDKDKIYIEIQKDAFDPATAEYAYSADFYDEKGEKKLTLHIGSGTEFAQASLMYGTPGDTKTTAVSDYEHEDLGDASRYTIVLNDPYTKIAGGDNLPIPISFFESLKSCTYEAESGRYVEIPAEACIKFDVDRALMEARGNGSKKLDELLYQNDKDREYLTPARDDYRVDIFDTKAIVYESCRIDRKPGTGEWVFGTDVTGNSSLKPCKAYRVYEYNEIGQLVSYKEKTEYESESDALHVTAAAGVNGNHALYFVDWTGVNEVPDGFTDEQGLRVICDENLPRDYENAGREAGYSSSIVRYENVYYFTFVLNDADHINKEYFTGICEGEMLGDYLHADGVEFSADNADDEGFIYMEDGANSATIYYSKPDAHRHNISYGEKTATKLPDDFVTMEYDSQYFAPKGDDYILYYTKFEDYGDYCFNSDAALVSFDENGKLIDARYRFFRPSNMVNTMSECVEPIMQGEGVKLLYSDDTYAYFDITDSTEFREYIGDGQYSDRIFTKQEMINDSLDEDNVKMPMQGWSDENGLFVSK